MTVLVTNIDDNFGLLAKFSLPLLEVAELEINSHFFWVSSHFLEITAE
jgi:hypothetical protein